MKKLHILVAFAALLVACDRDVPRPVTDNLPSASANVVQGRLMALPDEAAASFGGGAAEMTAASTTGELPFRTTVDAGGNFRLSLGTPSASMLSPVTTPGCVSNLTVTPPTLRVGTVESYVVRRSGAVIGGAYELLTLTTLDETTETVTFVQRI